MNVQNTKVLFSLSLPIYILYIYINVASEKFKGHPAKFITQMMNVQNTRVFFSFSACLVVSVSFCLSHSLSLTLSLCIQMGFVSPSKSLNRVHNSHYECPLCKAIIFFCLSISLFICLSVCLSICLSVCLSICLSVPLSFYITIFLWLSLTQSLFHMPLPLLGG